MTSSLSARIAEAEAQRAAEEAKLPHMVSSLQGVERCPHCTTARPTMVRRWMSDGGGNGRGDGGERSKWGAYACTTCGGMLLAKGKPGVVQQTDTPVIVAFFPEAKTVSHELPPVAREFLRQAFTVLHAPDAAAVMAGSAVDAMLKELGFEKGSLYTRIDEALAAGVLTKGMADWAHSVRLGSNRPRHADKDDPHVSPDDAKRSVDFAEALGNFLFVLTAQIQRATAAAQRS